MWKKYKICEKSLAFADVTLYSSRSFHQMLSKNELKKFMAEYGCVKWTKKQAQHR